MGQAFSSLLLSLLILLFFHLLCYSPIAAAAAAATTAVLQGGSNATDQLALISFKLRLSNDHQFGALASWNNSLPFCQWPGITCSRRHPQRVTSLDLESYNLQGSISPSLGNLTFLRRIHLPGNQLHGSIPQELGRLFRLQYLNLSSNSLQGSLPPTLFNSSSLRNISFRNNQLDGVIPSSLPPLTVLDLSNNILTGGIPTSLGNVSGLSYLDLSNNSLIGSIPSSMGKLSSLTVFDLSRNNLTGDMPPSIWNLSYLIKLEVHTNNLSGTIPPDMGNSLPNLQRLLLYENQFGGLIPVSIANASRLETFQAYYNNFIGTIPWNLGLLKNLLTLVLGDNQLEARDARDWRFFTGLTNCTNLQILDVSNNRLGGVLPHAIANLSTTLTWLGMMGNYISGSIPPEIANLYRLNEFRIRTNLLTGTIPATIGRLQMLHDLFLSANMFHGEIPSTIGNLTQLNRLHLEGNYLTGNIPKAIGNCKNLILLNLGYNKLNGTIPIEIVTISSLSIYLSFSDNLLTGPLPTEVGHLTGLDAFDISNNRLSGEIPSSLGDCRSMEFLFMEGNLFQGGIPESFTQLRGLQELDLSRNNLSGNIPKFLAEFQYLANLNLSFNNFEGDVPKFANLNAISILGNNKLCGGSPNLHLQPCPSQPSAQNHSSARVKVISLVVGSVLCLIFIACFFAACYWMRRKRKSVNTTTKKDSNMKASYSDLVKATDGFSAANLIGAGSFGSVYKATMEHYDNVIVAVKVFNQQQHGVSKSFLAECDALRNVRHRNLVKILTACSSVDFKGNDFKALVFEFMPNGSLEEWLHPKMHEQSELRALSLIQRLNIAIDVVSALEYLHHHCHVPIVHCDLKPSNVLLDNDMIAHVSDFGLARFLNKTECTTSQNPTSSSGLKGTVGYVAPEYGMANKVSTQGDVYSYGILLLEMFTGKRPTDHVFSEGLSLRKFVDMAFPGRVTDIVDSQIFPEEDGEDNGRTPSTSNTTEEIHECLAAVLKIGLSCTQDLPSERMQTGDVAKAVMAVKDAFLEGGTRTKRREKRDDAAMRGE